MDRRAFLYAAAASALTTGARPSPLGGIELASSEPASMTNPRALIMDAMGELRPIYPESLVRQMLDSGTDAITVTLCDPEVCSVTPPVKVCTPASPPTKV